jgi:hypothetical protein
LPRPRGHVLVPSGPRVALGDLSGDGVDRLIDYCRRVTDESHELVDRPFGERQYRQVRRVPYVGPRLREFVREDVEVREALLRMEFKVLKEAMGFHGPGSAGNLLDLMCAMSLEAEGRGHE